MTTSVLDAKVRETLSSSNLSEDIEYAVSRRWKVVGSIEVRHYGSQPELASSDSQVMLSQVHLPRHFLIAHKNEVERCLCLAFGFLQWRHFCFSSLFWVWWLTKHRIFHVCVQGDARSFNFVSHCQARMQFCVCIWVRQTWVWRLALWLTNSVLHLSDPQLLPLQNGDSNRSLITVS